MALAEEPPVQPVFTQTGLDGQLIGLELKGVQFGIWKPIAAAAYGLESGRIRYKAGVGLDVEFTLPSLFRPTRIGDFYAALGDWFETPVLGREGQRGVEAGFRWGETRYTGFFGTLWPRSAEGPDAGPLIGYLTMTFSKSLKLPVDLTLTVSSRTVLGWLLPVAALKLESTSQAFDSDEEAKNERKTFRSTTYALNLQLGDLRLSGQWGMLENPAELAGFEFTTGVRGIARTLQGQAFWNVTLNKTLPMYEARIKLPTPPELARFLPTELPVTLQGALIVQTGGVLREPQLEVSAQKSEGSDFERSLEHEALLSWGLSATLSVGNARLGAALIISQEGETIFRLSL
jgi:hypothetical protein